MLRSLSEVLSTAALLTCLSQHITQTRHKRYVHILSDNAGSRNMSQRYRLIYSWFAGGNSNVTSLPVKRRYTEENESSLYSSDVASLGSRMLQYHSTSRQSIVKHATYTFKSFDPSTDTRVLLPTISVGKTRSSRIFSCTLVSVRERGLFCFTRELRVGLLSIRR